MAGEHMRITRKIEFDAGHRIPDHNSKCRNAHGHRYVLEASLEGKVKNEKGASDDGMVQDFGTLKDVMMATVGEPWDHAFLVYRYDNEMMAALSALPKNHKTVVLDCIPTVENLADIAFDKIDRAIRGDWGEPQRFHLYRVRLYETPNCWADSRGRQS